MSNEHRSPTGRSVPVKRLRTIVHEDGKRSMEMALVEVRANGTIEDGPLKDVPFTVTSAFDGTLYIQFEDEPMEEARYVVSVRDAIQQAAHAEIERRKVKYGVSR